MKYLIVIIFIIISNTSFAQVAGSFRDSLEFNSELRTIAGYIPIDYKPNTKYKLMICLHGAQDTENNYLNSLIETFKYHQLFIKTIFIAPSGGDDQIRDFSSPQNDEEIIQKCIDYATNKFNIDSNNIILQGFSLGARSALRYALNYPNKFKSLLLFTPAFQGPFDLENKIPHYGKFYNFDNLNKIPIFVTCGENDITYIKYINKFVEKAKLSDAHIKYNVIENIGHQPPNYIDLIQSIEFVDSNNPDKTDLDIFKIELPDFQCFNQIAPLVYIRNNGNEPINSFEYTYSVLEQNFIENWNGTIAPNQHIILKIPQIAVTDGNHTFNLKIDKINQNTLDTNLKDNSISQDFIIYTISHKLPFIDNFDSNTFDWNFLNWDNIFRWFKDTTYYKSQNKSIFSNNNLFFFYTKSNHTSIASPPIDLSTAKNPTLYIDYAYNYIKYTAPYFERDTIFADTLEISISIDCGKTYQSIFKKNAKELATTKTPIANPTTFDATIFKPSKKEWKKIEINLNEYATTQNAIFKISNISDMGGTIYIDNFEIKNGKKTKKK